MADKRVNEDLYNWINKSYGLQPAEWYRNNPQKPSESNPFLPKGSYVPKAATDDPYRSAVASAEDPYRSTESSAQINKPKTKADYTDAQLAALPFDQILQVLAATPGSDYEDIAKDLSKTPYFQPQDILSSVQKIGGQFTPVSQIPQEYYYERLNISPPGGAIWVEDTGPLARKYFSDPGAKSIDEQYQQAAKEMWAAAETDRTLALEKYNPKVENLFNQIRNYANEFSNKYAGTLREEYQGLPYGSVSLPSRADLQSMQEVEGEKLREDASEDFLKDYLEKGGPTTIASADWPSGPGGKPEPPVIPSTDPQRWPRIPGGPSRPGPSGTGERYPLATNQQEEKFESAVAKALPQSDKKRQSETFQSEFDPQKARTAAQAASNYRVGSSNSDPFRQSAFA